MTKQDRRDGYAIAGWTLSGTVVAIVIGTIAVLLIGGITYLIAPWKGEVEARNNTIGNGQYVVASYNWYFDQCGSIQSAEQKVALYKSQLSATPSPAADEAVRLGSAVLAQSNNWIGLVNEYNANADKEKYKAKFKDDRLPQHIEPSNLNNGIETICA